MSTRVIKRRRTAAIRRLEDRGAFWKNLVGYVVVNAFLVGAWVSNNGAGYFWPAWVIIGWGIGIVMHGWIVFGEMPVTEAEIEEKSAQGGQTAS